jgi:hypothetical protein
MAQNNATTAAEDRSETKRSALVEDMIDELRNADSLAETPFGKLFQTARTAGRNYSGATVQVRVRDGELEASDPVKTRRGEHLRGTDAWDGMISLPSKAFMTADVASDHIAQQLKHVKKHYLRVEAHEESQR